MVTNLNRYNRRIVYHLGDRRIRDRLRLRIVMALVILATCTVSHSAGAPDPDKMFPSPVQWPVGTNPQWLVFGDLDSDGDEDIAVANQQDENVSVLLNNKDGTFVTPVNYSSGEHIYGFAVSFDTIYLDWTVPKPATLLLRFDGSLLR